MAKSLKVILLLVLLSPAFVQGWDFFGLFKKSTTPAPTDLPSTTTEAVTTTEQGTCWWTRCGTRCTATASVHDFTGTSCNPGQYKFRCCAS